MSHFRPLSIQSLFLLISLSQFALFNLTAQSFNFNENCQNAYKEILSLRLQSGQQLLQQERKQQPENLVSELLANYIDVLTIFISENEKVFHRLENNKDIRLELVEKGNPTSPFYLYTQAEINFQWALARLKFGEYITAFWEVRKAYKLLEENKKKFPYFYPNDKTLGVIHALVGTIPDSYLWGLKILGLHGDIKQGMAELHSFVKQSEASEYLLYDEAILTYAFFLVYLQEKHEKAWQVVQKLPKKSHLLNTYLAADIALRTARNDKAIQLLEQKPSNQAYLPFHFLDYFLGTVKLNRLDSDAHIPLRKFVSNFKGKNYIKTAYQKLAWHYYLQDDIQKYQYYRKLCLTSGEANIDIDKQALKEMKVKQLPNKELLKVRLLYDGAYYTKALAVLNQTNSDAFTSNQEHLTYVYRYARIYEGLGKYDKAIPYYKETIAKSSQLTLYYAPKSCLQLGKIYEGRKERTKAIQYYKKCFAFDDYEYENSIEQQAKAGLNRLGQ